MPDIIKMLCKSQQPCDLGISIPIFQRTIGKNLNEGLSSSETYGTYAFFFFF